MKAPKIYMAPMEGITVHTLRNSFNEFYTGVDTFYSPFIAAEGSNKMKKREKKDIAPENNAGLDLVPQIISNNSDNFIRFARIIKELGYREVNLNLGCPSGTVVAKHKGSGFLGEPELLDRFLCDIYDALDGEISVSIKTRVGLKNEEEIYHLLEIYNKYPICELIVHPRVRTDFYNGKPRMDSFEYVYKNSKCPVCYNGDIKYYKDYSAITEKYPELSGIMLGRGLIRNPLLAASIAAGKELDIDLAHLKAYHDHVYNLYKEQIMPNETVVIYKMKELWYYMLDLFADDNGTYLRLFKKANTLSTYNVFANRVFRECPLK